MRMNHLMGAAALLLASQLAPPVLAAQIRLRPGYFSRPYLDGGFDIVTAMTRGPKGRVWISSLGGSIAHVEDKNGDGKGELTTFATAGRSALGLTFVGGDLYVSHLLQGVGTISVFRDKNNDGVPDKPRITVISGTGRWTVGGHQNNAIHRGPDGWVYVGIGTWPKDQTFNATISRFLPRDPAGTLEVFARGIRNSYDHCWDAKGNLFCTDNEREGMGPGFPPDEVNHVRKGGDYGFPHSPPGVDGIQPICETTAHSSTNGICWYDHPRFPGMRNTVFVTQFKPNSGKPFTTGRRVASVKLRPFAGTFRTELDEGFAIFPRDTPPLAILVRPQGDLLVTQFRAGRIDKISYPYLAMPATARIGSRVAAEVSGRAGTLWLLIVSGGTGKIPIGGFVGDLLLDPATMVVLAAGVMLPADATPVQIPIPAANQLRGLTLYFQAAASLTAGGGVFTNRAGLKLQ